MANDITTEDQEMGGAMKLSKSAIRRAYWDWMFYNLSVQNFERMQGPAIIKMLADVREDPYPGDPEAQQEMLERHEVFFNTEPYLGSIVPGIVLGMEASKAEGNDEISSEFINSIKTALMGPFAGIGDSLLPGTLIPILLSIALGMSPNGEVTGPIFYIVVFLAIMLGAMVAGAAVGWFFPVVKDADGTVLEAGATIFKPLGTVFINLMFCIVVPMVFASISTASTSNSCPSFVSG